MTEPRRQGPVLIDLGDAPAPSPAEAPPIAEPLPEGRAMQAAIRLGTARPSWLWRVALRTGGALVVLFVALAAWDRITALIAAVPVLGWVATVLAGLFLLAALGLAAREAAALARLRRIDRLQQAAAAALATADIAAARAVTQSLTALYANRSDLGWARARLHERAEQAFDADSLLALAETELLTPLDAAARAEIEAAARTVATVTALVPLALADVVAALTANLRMIRRIAEIYGGRGGSFGGLRLARTVLTHLVATGAVAVGDDMIETVAGGGLLTKLSRRFGEGVVNGALTARVGIAAIEVCRPLPFLVQPRPRVSGLVARALKGLFGTPKDTPAP